MDVVCSLPDFKFWNAEKLEMTMFETLKNLAEAYEDSNLWVRDLVIFVIVMLCPFGFLHAYATDSLAVMSIWIVPSMAVALLIGIWNAIDGGMPNYDAFETRIFLRYLIPAALVVFFTLVLGNIPSQDGTALLPDGYIWRLVSGAVISGALTLIVSLLGWLLGSQMLREQRAKETK